MGKPHSSTEAAVPAGNAPECSPFNEAGFQALLSMLRYVL